MEKERFIEVLKHYSKSSENEAFTIISLKQSFPYSQVLHASAARLSKDHHLEGQGQTLQLAAVYAADRGVLKNVMTLDDLVVGSSKAAEVFYPLDVVAEHSNGYHFRESAENHVSDDVNGVIIDPLIVSAPEATIAAQAPVTQNLGESGSIIFRSQPVHDTPSEVAPTIEPTNSRDVAESSVADEVMNDLERLHQLKHDFEAVFESNKASQIAAAQQASEPEAIVRDEPLLPKSKRDRIIELAKALDFGTVPTLTPDQDLDAQLRQNGSDKNILEEIAHTKEAIEPESLKQQEQIQIIDNFIKTQPRITSAKDKLAAAPEGDLSTIKTGEFSDNIVSETLVDILVKQGKKDKAIEVLKKLIWKFPQKKAYFAAQIEDLKK